jgi:hypothetical protein
MIIDHWSLTIDYWALKCEELCAIIGKSIITAKERRTGSIIDN